MARALGLNPKKLGSLANHRQEPWKLPLPQFIEEAYFKRYGVQRPAEVSSLEELIAKRAEKKQQDRMKREAKHAAEEAARLPPNEP